MQQLTKRCPVSSLVCCGFLDEPEVHGEGRVPGGGPAGAGGQGPVLVGDEVAEGLEAGEAILRCPGLAGGQGLDVRRRGVQASRGVASDRHVLEQLGSVLIGYMYGYAYRKYTSIHRYVYIHMVKSPKGWS